MRDKLIVILVSLALFVIGVMVGNRYNKVSVTSVTKIDTLYVDSPPLVIRTNPKNTVTTKYETIYKKGETKTDTFIKVVYQKNKSTFTSLDTLRKDSLYVIVSDSGNCLGIINRVATFGGKEKIIQKTITNTIHSKPPLFAIYGGVNGVYSNKTIETIQPNLMLLYKGNLGFEYGYGLNNNSHNLGVKIKIK
jgi:hypothetical protein